MIQNVTAFLTVKKIKPTTMKSSSKQFILLCQGQNFFAAKFENSKRRHNFSLDPHPPPCRLTSSLEVPPSPPHRDDITS